MISAHQKVEWMCSVTAVTSASSFPRRLWQETSSTKASFLGNRTSPRERVLDRLEARQVSHSTVKTEPIGNVDVSLEGASAF